MAELPNGMSIKELTFDQLQELRPKLRGWVYPRRKISPFIPLFSWPQQAALSFYVVIAIGMFLAGLLLPFVLGSWWWLLLLPGAVMVWKANRKSMEQFFLENLQGNPVFYDSIRQTEMGNLVKVVLPDDRRQQ